MYCCGSPYQTITVRTGAHSLALLRCTHCDDQRWARDGVLLDRYSAFAELASAYRDVPLRARTVDGEIHRQPARWARVGRPVVLGAFGAALGKCKGAARVRLPITGPLSLPACSTDYALWFHTTSRPAPLQSCAH